MGRASNRKWANRVKKINAAVHSHHAVKKLLVFLKRIPERFRAQLSAAHLHLIGNHVKDHGYPQKKEEGRQVHPHTVHSHPHSHAHAHHGHDHK